MWNRARNPLSYLNTHARARARKEQRTNFQSFEIQYHKLTKTKFIYSHHGGYFLLFFQFGEKGIMNWQEKRKKLLDILAISSSRDVGSKREKW